MIRRHLTSNLLLIRSSNQFLLQEGKHHKWYLKFAQFFNFFPKVLKVVIWSLRLKKKKKKNQFSSYKLNTTVQGCAWAELGEWRAIFLTNPIMVGWENSNRPPTYQSMKTVNQLKSAEQFQLGRLRGLGWLTNLNG